MIIDLVMVAVEAGVGLAHLDASCKKTERSHSPTSPQKIVADHPEAAQSFNTVVAVVRRRFLVLLTAAGIAGAVVGSGVAMAGLAIYHSYVTTHAVASVTVPWNTINQELASQNIKRRIPVIGDIAIHGLTADHDQERMVVKGTVTIDPTIGGPTSFLCSVSGIPVVHEQRVYLAAISVKLQEGKTTTDKIAALLAADLLGAWTSDHAVVDLSKTLPSSASVVTAKGTTNGVMVMMTH